MSAAARAEGVAPLDRKLAAKDYSRLLGPSTRVPFGAFELYIFGQVLVLTGGSALFILLYAERQGTDMGVCDTFSFSYIRSDKGHCTNSDILKSMAKE